MSSVVIPARMFSPTITRHSAAIRPDRRIRSSSAGLILSTLMALVWYHAVARGAPAWQGEEGGRRRRADRPHAGRDLPDRRPPGPWGNGGGLRGDPPADRPSLRG